MTPKTKEQYLEEIKGILNEAAGLPLEQYAELCEEVYLEAGTRQDNVEDEIASKKMEEDIAQEDRDDEDDDTDEIHEDIARSLR
jgi:hypothetical protein